MMQNHRFPLFVNIQNSSRMGYTIIDPQFSNLNASSRELSLKFGIRLDWGYELDSLISQSPDLANNINFFGNHAFLHNWSMVYSNNYLAEFRKAYPFDSLRLLSYREKDEPNHREEIRKIFPPKRFGITYISHAHADHVPLNTQRHGVSSGDFQGIYPFPVLCTPFTAKIINERFKVDLVGILNTAYIDQCITEHAQTRALEYFRSSGFHFQAIESEYEKYLKIGRNTPNSMVHKGSQNFQGMHLDPLDHFLRKDFYHVYRIGNWLVWMMPTGHICGSSGLCVRAIREAYQINGWAEEMESGGSSFDPFKADIIYLDEFCPIPRPHCLSCPPVSCNKLIVDGLFIDPDLNIPDQWQEILRCVNWIEQEVARHPVILFCSALGKPQLLTPYLFDLEKQGRLPEDCALVSDAETIRLMRLCQNEGIRTCRLLTLTEARQQKYQKDKNYILVTDGGSRHDSSIQKLVEDRCAKTADVTGWCYDPDYRCTNKADEYFTITDHATYNDLICYLKGCKIEELQFVNQPSYPVYQQLKNEGYPVMKSVNLLSSLTGSVI